MKPTGPAIAVAAVLLLATLPVTGVIGATPVEAGSQDTLDAIQQDAQHVAQQDIQNVAQQDTQNVAQQDAEYASQEDAQNDTQADAGNVTRNGDELEIVVSASGLDEGENATTVRITVPDVEHAVSVEADREGDRYVARLPVTDLVPPTASANLSAATVGVQHGERTVLEDEVDLRYVMQTGPATFRNGSLSIPADVRGLGTAAPRLVFGGSEASIDTTVSGAGPNASLSIRPSELSGRAANRTFLGTIVIGNATVSDRPIRFAIGEAAGRATAIGYRDGEPILRQPLLHPDLGPERIDLTVSTTDPDGHYAVGSASSPAAGDVAPSVPVPASVVGANEIRVGVEDENGSTLVDVPVRAPGRATVSLRVENGSLHAPDTAALSEYEAMLLRDGNVSYVPIGDALRAGHPQSLPAAIADPDQDATALLVGPGVRPARVDLTVVPPPVPSDSEPDPPPADPDQDEFVGLWVDIGSIVSLLFVAMIGSVLSVGTIYGLRLLSPARSAAAGPRAVFGHFLFGGLGGIACIAAVQSTVTGPVLGTVSVGGAEVGLGALLVGLFHGGLTATGIRLGLGTVENWPTRRVVDETAVPVRVRFTDDEGDALPGEQTVEVRRAEDGSVVETTGLAGTTTEVELSAGAYVIRGSTAERETDPVDVAIDEPETPRPETRSVHLTVGRPGFQVEVTDAQHGEPIPDGQVTVTTDRDQTRSVPVEDGTVTTTLPVGAGTVTTVVSAPGYDDATIDTAIDAELTTVDVALDPASGTLVATALVRGEPIPDATVAVEPAEATGGVESAEEAGAVGSAEETGTVRSAEGTGAVGSTEGGEPTGTSEAGDDASGAGEPTPEVGVRTVEGATDETGRVSLELPAGSYRVQLEIDGPNAELFATNEAVATVGPDDEATATVQARFGWEPSEQVRHRASSLRSTIRSVAEEATADPTIPLYFAGVTEALLDCVDALPRSGQHFAASTQDPDEVAAATVAAAEAALEAVGQAMQADGARAALASGREPVRTAPDLDASPEDLLDYLERELTVASVESRANEVATVLDGEAESLGSVAPARAVLQKAVGLVGDGDTSTHTAAREFAALLLLDAVEQCLTTPEIRERLDDAG